MSNYQHKTKAELIKELKKLKELNNLLVSSHKKKEKKQDDDEQKLHKKDLLFRKLSANVPDLIYQFTRRTDGSYFVPIASEGIKNIFGCSPEDVLNDFAPITKVIYPEDFDRVINDIEYSAKHLTYFTCEFRVQLPGKEIQWILSNSTPEKLPDGSVTWYGFNANITEQKKTEGKLKKAALLLQSSIESPKDMIVLSIDKNYSYLYFNEFHKSTMLYAYGQEVKIGMNLLACITSEEDRIKAKINYDKALNGESHITIEEYGDIQKAYYETRYNPIFNDKNEIIGTTAFSANITDRKQAEKDLIESEYRFRKLYEDGATGMAMVNKDFKFLMANRMFCQMLGYQEEELQLLTFLDVTHPDDKDKDISQVKKMIAGEIDVYRTEKRYLNKNGQTIWAQITLSTFYDSNGRFLYNLAIIINITERKIAEESLRESETKLKRILNNLQDAYLQADLDGNITFVNITAAKIYGYANIQEMIGLPTSNLYKDKVEREKLIVNLSTSEKLTDIIGEGLKKDGTTFWVSISVQYLKDNQGKIIGTEGLIRDITSRKNTEDEILKLSQAVEQSPASIILTDTKGNVEYANPKALKITGYNLDELKGKNPRIFSSGEKPKSEYKDLWETILSGQEWRGEFHNKKKNGELYWELASISPIINEKGEIINFLAVKEDITERKQILNDLVAAKEKAEESDRLKSAFLANMSHEIRTPMNGILGFAGLLKEPGISGQKQQKYIKIIEKSGERMLNIINDIIDISKIESGTMKMYINETDINEKIENLYHFFKPEAKAKNIQFSVEQTLPNNETIVKTDSEKVHAVLSNLLKNAIKFTNKGKIEFGVGYESSSSGKKQLKFFVKDTGMGIPIDRQQAIFERFIQADVHDKMALQGAGLGLSISKAYVEMLGGKIWVESQERMGSVFYFTIPCNDETEKVFVQDVEASIKTDYTPRKLKILIAEDDEASQMLLSMIVEEFTSEIFIANDGIEAVEIYKNNPDIDLILMDVKMPNLNGYDATQQIRELNKNVVIIGQTAYALSFDRQKVMDAGCNDYISKPILMNDLKTLIRKHFKV
ncbi:MAG: PAS domain S-box protein [Flavobacteriales bacterium]|nr:PAS domain S-box protein [Flavobacteriales bacterium]NCP90574.1 PAS domain S-box protein [Flavobacteriales bacterium]NCQ13918.1 PAS domain S-box protein [Flavobacteriales bacterium]NCQ57454.1 PAS domain S-box protein [Flavobacteriales bacterium]